MKITTRLIAFCLISICSSASLYSESISGNVTDGNGGLSGIGITFYRLDAESGEWVSEGTRFTDNFGGYHGDLPAGTYRVEYRDYGSPTRFLPEYWNDSETFEGSTELILAENDVIILDDVELSPVQVTGTITITDSDGEILPGITVRAYTLNSETDQWEISAVATSDGNGVYVLGRLPSTSSEIKLEFLDESGGFQGEFYLNATTLESATPIELTESIAEINASLHPIIEIVAPQILGIEPYSENSFRLIFSGQISAEYQVEISTTLTGWGNYGAPFIFNPDQLDGDTMDVIVEQEGSKTFWRIKEVPTTGN